MGYDCLKCDAYISIYLQAQILSPHLEPLTDEQGLHVYNLNQACQQAEDALSQGMEKLHQFLAESVANGLLADGNYLPQLEAAMENLEALERFVKQVIYSYSFICLFHFCFLCRLCACKHVFEYVCVFFFFGGGGLWGGSGEEERES